MLLSRRSLAWWKALREALQELGYVEGRSIAFEARWAQGRVDRLPGLAAELVQLQVNVIVTGGGEAARESRRRRPFPLSWGAERIRCNSGSL